MLLHLGEKLEEWGSRPYGEQLRERLIRVWLVIRDKQGCLVRLRPNRAQKDYGRKCGRRNIILKARQMGITTWVAARFFLKTITRAGMLTVLVAQDQESAEEIFRIVQRFWANLPEPLREGPLQRSHANVRQMVFPLLDSEYRVETAADQSAGRGLTIQNLHASEVGRWPRDAKATLASLRAAVSPGGEVVLESTPNGAVGCFYDEWQRANETGHVRHFFPWWWEPTYRKSGAVLAPGEMSLVEKELVARHGLSEEQIAYRRELKANFLSLSRQEFAEDAETCFLASGECVFEVERIDARLKECVRVELAPGEIEYRMLPALERHRYIIGVDAAGGGTDGDYACAEVVDRKTGMQCLELHGHLTPEELAREIVRIAEEYNHALIAVESNGLGRAVISNLKMVQKFEHLYWSKNGVGFTTTDANKHDLVASLGAMLADCPQIFNSARLLQEMRCFVRHSDGRRGAISGSHDDRVMTMGIALLVRIELAGQA